MLFVIFISLLNYMESGATTDIGNKAMGADELQRYLSDVYPFQEQSRRCPAPVLPVTSKACAADKCTKDEDCSQDNVACCFNGCRHTCLQRLPPPAVIDWEVEMLETGSAITAPDSRNSSELPTLTVSRCTTSFRHAPSLPRGCPVGYSCIIQDPGDPINGIPNRGLCIPDHPTDGVKLEEDEVAELKEKKGKESVFLPGGCLLTKEQYLNIQDFLHRTYVLNCTCLEGSIECQLAKSNSTTDVKQLTKS